MADLTNIEWDFSQPLLSSSIAKRSEITLFLQETNLFEDCIEVLGEFIEQKKKKNVIHH